MQECSTSSDTIAEVTVGQQQQQRERHEKTQTITDETVNTANQTRTKVSHVSSCNRRYKAQTQTAIMHTRCS